MGHRTTATDQCRYAQVSSAKSRRVALSITAWLILAFAGTVLTVIAEPPIAKDKNDARNLARLLIKNALISVNQGNLTGNYTVLRDLASPSFRERNSAADLGTIFAGLREQKLDLSPIVLIEPEITHSKYAKDEQQLRLTGLFPSEPIQIKFDLIFQRANPGGWMIHGVSIGTATTESRTPDDPLAVDADSVVEPHPSKAQQVSGKDGAPASAPPGRGRANPTGSTPTNRQIR